MNSAALSAATGPALPLPMLRDAYRRGALTPRQVAAQIAAAFEQGGADAAWIARVPRAALLARADALLAHDRPETLPLYGVPFAVKDNVDVAGLPTTAACPAFAYVAESTAPVVQRLLDAGALLVGKTNLDQFATGLVGTRSPYGAVPNAFNPAFISGGSSSGSASAVARGLASFALGTDTAGSGRVPAAFNNVVGLKPTRGLLSNRGVVPACRTLDCVSVFALTCDDAGAVFDVAAAFDPADPFARRSAPAQRRIAGIGVPRAPEFFGDALSERGFAGAVARARRLGLRIAEVDFAPLHAAAELLYGGPWVAERYAAIRSFFDAHADAVEPSVRAIIAGAAKFSAADAFDAHYRLAALARECERIFDAVDALLVPTAPTIYAIAEVERDPIGLNQRLGLYTNFVNLLDLAALAVPASMRADGLPFGVTFIAPANSDAALLELGSRWQRDTSLPLGATGAALPPAPPLPARHAPRRIRVAVVGAHLTGLPLNHQLTERDAACVATTATAPRYRLFALRAAAPPKPGLQRVAEGGAAIALEVWEMPLEKFGSFVAEVPPPLAVGSIELADGTWVKGFVCEPCGLAGARDITSFGGWRAYLAASASFGVP